MSAVAVLSGNASSQHSSETKALDAAVGALKDNAERFAKTPVAEKVALLRETVRRVEAAGDEWVRAGHAAKGLPADHGEEWLVGPVPTLRNVRLLADTLERIGRGEPAIGAERLKTRPDGRVEARVFPTDALDSALVAGIEISELMAPGLDAKTVKEQAGGFYKKSDPKGGVSLILGAGNLSSIPPMDALYKSFAEGYVTVIKMNPVNEWAGPFIERSFAPFIERNFLRVVYGGSEVGRHLVNHPAVEDIHITGSNHTHDLIVWGPLGPERERRIREKDPLLKKRITSELGNVSPVAIVPGDYPPNELEFMAKNLGAMITNNASFNCNAAKLLITAKNWKQKDQLLGRLKEVLAATPPRNAYYPGAQARYDELTGGRPGLLKIGEAKGGQLPWTLIPNVDASKKDDPLFSTEPFCSILSMTEVDAADPAEFVRAMIPFLNDQVWGTLNAMLVVPTALEHTAEMAKELDRAIVELRYGTVAINFWPAMAYGTVSPAWGGHPSATLENVQSGIGWVHNTFLLEGIDKTIVRGKPALFPKPIWFADNKKVDAVGRRLLRAEAAPSWLKVPGIALAAMQG